MYVCMYVCIHTYVSLSLYIYVYIYIYTYMCPPNNPAESRTLPECVFSRANINNRRTLQVSESPVARHLLASVLVSTFGRALHRQPGVGSPQPQEKVLRPAGGKWELPQLKSRFSRKGKGISDGSGGISTLQARASGLRSTAQGIPSGT